MSPAGGDKPREVKPRARIAAEGLHKTDGSSVAAEGSTFEVDHGEVFGIGGPNGADTMTTLKSVTAEIEDIATSGGIRLTPGVICSRYAVADRTVALCPGRCSLSDSWADERDLVGYGANVALTAAW
ncbi:MAG: hypothetical protein ABEJ86_06740 [Halococcoides sp.]